MKYPLYGGEVTLGQNKVNVSTLLQFFFLFFISSLLLYQKRFCHMYVPNKKTMKFIKVGGVTNMKFIIGYVCTLYYTILMKKMYEFTMFQKIGQIFCKVFLNRT